MKINLIEELYGIKPNEEIISKFNLWEQLFIEYNSHTNLMSKNDMTVLFEKHALDSLSIKLFEGFISGIKLLDVGAGGGFPSLILAICFPEIQIIAMDSVKKKTDFLTLAKEKLKLQNFEVVLSRAENYPPVGADIIVNRAVGKIDKVWAFSGKHLKKGGAFISYKAKTGHEEAQTALKKYKELKLLKFIPYKLPLDDDFKRELVILENK